jgi:hypothetical protein
VPDPSLNAEALIAAGTRRLRRTWILTMSAVLLLGLAAFVAFFLLERRIENVNYQDHLNACRQQSLDRNTTNTGRTRIKQSYLIDAQFFESAAFARQESGTPNDLKTASEYRRFAERKRELAAEVRLLPPLDCKKQVKRP